jgi:CRP/FNR family cyclic AMP-dependent transcriptional regulator
LKPSIDLLRSVPLLDDLDDGDFTQIATFFTARSLRPGATLYAEGAPATSACVVMSGELDAFAKLPGGGEAKIGDISAGQVIGETALLNGGRRTASVRAKTEASVLEMSSALFQASLAEMDLPAHNILRRVIRLLSNRLSEVFGKIVTVMERSAAEPPGGAPSVEMPRPARTASEPFDWRPFLPLLYCFRRFAAEELEELLRFGEIREAPSQSVLFEEGEEADLAYVVLRGAVECAAMRGAKLQLSIIGPGRMCGVGELIERRGRRFHAVTRTGATLIGLKRDAFSELFLGEAPACLKFQQSVGLDQLNDLKTANNLLAILVNQDLIRTGATNDQALT